MVMPMGSGNDDDDDDAAAAQDDSGYGRPSKTQRKKAMLALQALGERLVALPESRLRAVPLEAGLRDAINHARSIRSHEGRRRQLQFIGKLMRSADAEAIEASLAGDDATHSRQVAVHHAAEQWRDGLIDGSRRIEDFLNRFPRPDAGDSDGEDRNGGSGSNAMSLAQLAAAAQQAGRGAGSNPGPARALYRALHQWLNLSEGQKP